MKAKFSIFTNSFQDGDLIQFTLVNPCVDPDYNSITIPGDFSRNYTVNQDPILIDYASGFSVKLASLCGSSLKYSVSIASGPSIPISDDSAISSLSIYSQDESLESKSSLI